MALTSHSDPGSLWMRDILFQEATRMATTQELRVTSSPEDAEPPGHFVRSVSPLP